MKQWLLNPRYMLPVIVALALVNSLLLPASASRAISQKPRDLLATVTSPVSKQLHGLTATIRRRLVPTPPQQLASAEDRDKLRRLIFQLQQQLELAHAQIEQLSAVRRQLGLAGTKLPVVAIAGFDLDPANPTVSFSRGSLSGLAEGQVVISGIDLVGNISTVAAGSSSAALICRDGRRIGVRFEPADPDQPFNGPDDTQLRYDAKLDAFHDRIELLEPQTLSAGDLAVLADPHWPAHARGFVVGVVEQIEPDPEFPLIMRRITVRPRWDLRTLSHLIVVVPVETDEQE